MQLGRWRVKDRGRDSIGRGVIWLWSNRGNTWKFTDMNAMSGRLIFGPEGGEFGRPDSKKRRTAL